MDQPIRYILCDLWVNKAKNLGTSWSKSIVLENKVVINFDFRNGAKKSGHSDHSLQSYGQTYVTRAARALHNPLSQPKYGWLK